MLYSPWNAFKVYFWFCSLMFAAGFAFGQTPSLPSEKTPSPKLLDTAALQIALDNEGFLPGVIDGKMGPKTELANKIASAAGRSILLPEKPWRTWKIPADF